MTTRTVEQVDNWGSRPFSGGYRGLQDLSDEDFSGIVTAGPTRLCMTKGTVVGILDGEIEDFEDASGTVHVAPSPALPLLAVMQQRTDEVRAQYYTEETPIREVDQTLSDGNFTGYIALSENVLSGDYYLVYHQGRSMSVAWVGESKQLLTDDEAFERANGEVGIYKVRPADIEAIEIPDAEEPVAAEPESAATTAPTETTAETTTTEVDAEPSANGDPDTADSDTQTVRDPEELSPDEHDAVQNRTVNQSTEAGTPDSSNTTSESEPADQEYDPQQQRDQTPDRTSREQSREQESPSQHSETPRREQTRQQRGREREQTGGTSPRETGTPAPERQHRATGSGDRSGTASELATRSIPSLDPGRTVTPSDQSESSSGPERDPQPEQTARPAQDPPARGGQPADSTHDRNRERQQPQSNSRRQPQDTTRQQSRDTQQSRDPQRPQQEDHRQHQPDEHEGQQSGQPERSATEGATSSEAEADPEEIERLESELADREDDIEDLESQLEQVEGERDALEQERNELRDRVEQLQERISELRTEDGSEGIADRRRLSPGEVFDGTNLFIRYASKGDATLEEAFKKNTDAGAVNDNLEIQYHTQFDAEDAAVNGEPFVEFLEGTLQYQFVEWFVRVLPYEIRDTGHEDSLRTLYEALPKIDRAELNGTISVVYEEDGDEHRSQETFDIVLRDRMGNPLAVSNLNESRQPASQSMMESLITASQRVGESKEALAGVFLVTSSFFEPEAMEAASAATGSGLLSRDKRQSFVKLSRKDGFHLCLVEAREEKFNLSVPEI